MAAIRGVAAVGSGNPIDSRCDVSNSSNYTNTFWDSFRAMFEPPLELKRHDLGDAAARQVDRGRRIRCERDRDGQT
jgi:hypothetical protein